MIIALVTALLSTIFLLAGRTDDLNASIVNFINGILGFAGYYLLARYLKETIEME